MPGPLESSGPSTLGGRPVAVLPRSGENVGLSTHTSLRKGLRKGPEVGLAPPASRSLKLSYPQVSHIEEQIPPTTTTFSAFGDSPA